ncbi:MAG: alpha-amylase family glycosyl hydrolase [Prevotella sp.]
MKKKISTLIFSFLFPSLLMAQGWPSNHQGVMLQGFYWDSYLDTQWTNLESQADELARFFNLIWIPQSANCNSSMSMGYDDYYWFTHYDSSFGKEAELRSMIRTFKDKGLGTIADVVINHRKNVSNWVDFPAETYNGKTYQLLSTDICADDDGGNTANWAAANGYKLSTRNDTGEGWSGMRDLDHYSSNVQESVKAYLHMLLNDLGYAGFRYDMVKGYSGSFTGLYNNDAQPTYSVGEYFDGNVSKLKSWLNNTKVNNAIQSAAFDFTMRYTVRDAINSGNWAKLATGGLATDAGYQRYAVTFVENHDTEYRSVTVQQDPIRKDTIAANAFILAMPGTPCVFLKHWIDCKRDIKNMIDVRNLVGIHNQSSFTQQDANTNYYATLTTGIHGNLLSVVGKGASTYSPASNWVKIAKGYHYAYYVDKSMETAWTDLPSGQYEGQQKATLMSITADADARIVYTTDGTEPTAQSTAVASGTVIDIPAGTTVLKAALLSGSTVSGSITRNYTVRNFEPYDITVRVNVDKVNWTKVNFWTWGGDGSHGTKNPTWPGDAVTDTEVLDGKTWYCHSYRINSTIDYVSFVFSTGTGSPQTQDINFVSKDAFFEVSTSKDGDGKHLVNDVTSAMTGISQPSIAETCPVLPVVVRSVSGQAVRRFSQPVSVDEALHGLPRGCYIVNRKKYVVR